MVMDTQMLVGFKVSQLIFLMLMINFVISSEISFMGLNN